MVRAAGDIGNDEGRVGTLPDFRSASLDAMRSRHTPSHHPLLTTTQLLLCLLTFASCKTNFVPRFNKFKIRIKAIAS